MVARSGVVFLVSMADILTNPVEIYFRSFTATPSISTTATSLAITVKIMTPLPI
jgi:hypothetical protein